ncbi:hypothetical protein [Sphingomonas sp.]|jgi:hypothetical protein|uniref:O-antigen ligase family protein n=1 Tax=Sphingomonas sp. TaxID=28214 RepID=UPI002ED8C81B
MTLATATDSVGFDRAHLVVGRHPAAGRRPPLLDEIDVFELIKTAGFVSALLVSGLFCLRLCGDRSLVKLLMTKLMLLTAVTQFAAFCAPSILSLNLIVGLSVPILATERRLIAPIYLFLQLTMPMVTVVLGFGSLYLLTFDVGMAAGLGALAALALRSRGTFSRTIVWDVPALLFFLLLVAQTARDTSATNVMRSAIEAGWDTLLPYYVVSRSLRTFEDVRVALFGLIAATVALCVLAFYEAFRHWPMYRVVFAHYGIPISAGAAVKLRGGFIRSPGPFPEPVSFAFCLAVGYIATYSIRSAFRSRYAHLAIIGITTVGILAPQSRGAWMGLIVGVVAYQLFRNQIASLGRMALCGVGLLVVVVASSSVGDRVTSTLGINNGPDYRVSLFSRGVEEVKKYPFIGRPIGQVYYSLRDLIQGEGIVDFVNTYLYMALVSGLIGLLIFVIVLISPMVPLWGLRSNRLIAVRDQQQIAFVFSGLAAMIVMYTVTSLGGRSQMLLSVMMALSAVIMNYRRALSRQGPRDLQRPPQAEAARASDPVPLPAT